MTTTDSAPYPFPFFFFFFVRSSTGKKCLQIIFFGAAVHPRRRYYSVCACFFLKLDLQSEMKKYEISTFRYAHSPK